MASNIEVEGDPQDKGFYILVVAGTVIASCECSHVLKRMAKFLSEARAAPARDAMRILTTELGMCDDYALHIYEELTGNHAHPTLQ